MKRFPATLLLSLAFVSPAPAQETATVRAAGPSFDALWATYVKAQRAGDVEGAVRSFQEIRRLRVERNIRSFDTLALALVTLGLERLGQGEQERAEELFRSASSLDPYLPDAHFGLALTELRKGPLGIGPAAGQTFDGAWARLASVRGQYHLHLLVVPVGLLTLFATVAIAAVALLLRHGTLLLHDLQESLGVGRARGIAVALFVFLLLVPLVTFQGWGWLPLWWLALLFVYLNAFEKTVALLLIAGALLVGPIVSGLEGEMGAARNPLFWTAVRALEAGPDARSTAELEAAAKSHPDDRDLVYLLAVLTKKAGRYEEAASLYHDILRADPSDVIARNNLANLEFMRRDFEAALARYKQEEGAALSAEAAATLSYNQSQAHLQKFEYPAAQEARALADRLTPRLITDYDRLWRYDKGDYAVVDLCLTADQLRAKFWGASEGIAVKNVARQPPAHDGGGLRLLAAAVNRFAAFAAVFLLTLFALSTWRGRRAFTMHCLKCGTAFCRRCHLGAVVAGLCSQCHHLFVVRDGVSGPARNRKLLEVQAEEERRVRQVRLLSLLAPGAGQIYARRTLVGALLVALWSLTLAAVFLGEWLLPVTEAPRALGRSWGLATAGILLVVFYGVAYRVRGGAESALPSGWARRGRAA